MVGSPYEHRSILMVLHLDFSVRIAAPGSHVPHIASLTASGHLNAGCRSVRRQVSPELIPQSFSGFFLGAHDPDF